MKYITIILCLLTLCLSAAQYSATQFIGQSAVGVSSSKSVTLTSGAAYLLHKGSTSAINENLPMVYALHQNYPNPFNPVTTIKFDLPIADMVSIKIYNITGAEVASLANNNYKAGYHAVNFNASSLSSGIYFYKLSVKSANYQKIMKMSLIK